MYFVTFHLKDSLPVKALKALKAKRVTFDEAYPPPHTDKTLLKRARDLAVEEERWLDQGLGTCPFREEVARGNLFELISKLDGDRYALGAWVVMPNHVHVLIRMLDDEAYSLEEALRRWKSGSARWLNRDVIEPEERWFSESYDRIVRDSEALWRCVQYIGRNGEKAGLGEGDYTRGVCDEWVELGWGFE